MPQDQEQDKDDHSSLSTQYFTEPLAGINKVGIERNLKMYLFTENKIIFIKIHWNR